MQVAQILPTTFIEKSQNWRKSIKKSKKFFHLVSKVSKFFDKGIELAEKTYAECELSWKSLKSEIENEKIQTSFSQNRDIFLVFVIIEITTERAFMLYHIWPLLFVFGTIKIG